MIFGSFARNLSVFGAGFALLATGTWMAHLSFNGMCKAHSPGPHPVLALPKRRPQSGWQPRQHDMTTALVRTPNSECAPPPPLRTLPDEAAHATAL